MTRSTASRIAARLQPESGPSLVLSNARLILADQILDGGWLEADGGRIVDIGAGSPPGQAIDLGGAYVAPGLIDLHCHGGGGASFTDAATEDVGAALHAHARNGTTTLMATTVSAPWRQLVGAVEGLAQRSTAPDEARLAGVNLEGPFISVAQRGCHDSRVLIDPSPERIRELIEAGRGTIEMITGAPELSGFHHLVDLAGEGGYRIAIGHTDADEATVRVALESGVGYATHLWNAMPKLHHRAPGPVGALLTSPEVFVEVIPDLVHVQPPVIDITAACKGPQRTLLVTDAGPLAGAPHLTSATMGEAELYRDGLTARTADGALYGTAMTLAEALPGAIRRLDISLVDLIAMMTRTPATVLGVENVVGTLAVGANADLVVLDPDSLAVRATYLGGRPITT